MVIKLTVGTDSVIDSSSGNIYNSNNLNIKESIRGGGCLTGVPDEGGYMVIRVVAALQVCLMRVVTWLLRWWLPYRCA